ncbi:TetR/AcrR family transcriptional regulator [Oerskovia flava]|uniref:TetR/AcrR family transcriptional regulator n=1 Tax=Oerskovia flava TaxID=2986422 RepID=UPI002240D072|nr:hypothetical protein [Oerskovia sp. JB1-3-2]
MPSNEPVRVPVTDPSPSQVRLMESAERLVGRFGLEGASSRAITRDAGHRNHSAIAYYFGSREGLLDSLYHWRSAPINAHRARMIDELVEAGEEHDARALVRAFVVPYVTAIEALAPSSWARFNVAVLAQHPLVFMDDVTRDIKRYNDIDVPLSTTLRLFAMMREVACDGREPVAGLRVAIVARSINANLAAWETGVEAGHLDQVPLWDLADEAIHLGTMALSV